MMGLSSLDGRPWLPPRSPKGRPPPTYNIHLLLLLLPSYICTDPPSMATSFLHDIASPFSSLHNNTCSPRSSTPGTASRIAGFLSWAPHHRRHREKLLRSSQLRKQFVHVRKTKVGDIGHASLSVSAVYTEKQESLVKESWAILKKDAARHGLTLFTKVFEIAPSAKKLFSFLKDSDVPQEQNQKLKSHALKVFVIICEAATSLREKGEVSTPGSTMKDMAHAHYVSGVVNEHYEVVEYCLLKTLEEGLPPGMWNEEMKEAWSQAYEELVRTMRAAETPA